MRKLFLLLICMLSSLAMNAQRSVTINGIEYEANQDGDAWVNICSKEVVGEVSILENVTLHDVNKKVTSIRERAFYECVNITSINIPNSVTSIGDGAFEGCSSLTSPVTIPEGVKEIKAVTFKGCSKLPEIKLPSGLTSIGSHAFAYCSSLPSITIPNGVTSIGYGAFEGCSGLPSIYIPSSIVEIGGYAFSGCENLVDVYNFENCSITEIKGLFKECKKIESIEIPNSVTTIGYDAFYNCSSLAKLKLPNINKKILLLLVCHGCCSDIQAPIVKAQISGNIISFSPLTSATRTITSAIKIPNIYLSILILFKISAFI